MLYSKLYWSCEDHTIKVAWNTYNGCGEVIGYYESILAVNPVKVLINRKCQPRSNNARMWFIRREVERLLKTVENLRR